MDISRAVEESLATTNLIPQTLHPTDPLLLRRRAFRPVPLAPLMTLIRRSWITPSYGPPPNVQPH
eukprot:11596660-Prorocentrum_lima.AAC.1